MEEGVMIQTMTMSHLLIVAAAAREAVAQQLI